MNILRIIPTMNPKLGGVAEAARQSAILMKKENINIEILCFDKYEDEWVKNAKYEVIALGNTKFSIGNTRTSYGLNIYYLYWLIKNAQKYDLIIFDGLWRLHLLGGYISKLKKIPYVVYTHGMLDPYFNKNKLKYLKKLPFWFLIDRNVLALAKYVIYTCLDEQNISKKSFPLFSSNDYIVTLGIPKNTQSIELLKETFYLTFPQLTNKKFGLYLSRIHEKKGLELLIDAIQENKNKLKEYIFVIAGTGDNKYIDKLKRMIENKNLNHLFLWVGNISGDTKWGAFSNANFFILPSHSENFGIVVAESLSMKTPVLTTNKVNIWREIEKFNAGIIENDDKSGISNLLNKFLDLDEKELSTMEKNSYQCYENSFSEEAYKKEFLAMIK